jgi:hypothetical protein
MNKKTNTVPKRSYQAPKLKKVGTVKSLTRENGGSNIDGNNGLVF